MRDQCSECSSGTSSLQPVEIDVLSFELIHQAGEFLAQLGSLGRRARSRRCIRGNATALPRGPFLRLAPLQHERSQNQLALEFADHAGHIGRARGIELLDARDDIQVLAALRDRL